LGISLDHTIVIARDKDAAAKLVQPWQRVNPASPPAIKQNAEESGRKLLEKLVPAPGVEPGTY
jgi:hypothetical protein